MKRIILVLLLLVSINVKAADGCDRVELNRLKAVAKKITYSYDFREQVDQNDDVVGGTFDIILDNISSEVKPMIIYSWIGMSFDEFVRDENGTANSNVFKPEGYLPGESVKITVKAYVDNDCIAKDLVIKTIRLPYFNYYVNSKECKTYPAFKLCKNRLTNTKITDRQFNAELNKYIEYNKENPMVMDVDNTILYIILGVIILVPVTIYVVSYIRGIYKEREELEL